MPSTIRHFISRFAEARSGAVAIILAITLPILIGLVFGAIDFTRAFTARQILQDSLDAATLFAGRSDATTDATLQPIGINAMNANIINMSGGARFVSATFKAADNGQRVIGTANGEVDTTILGLINRPTLSFSVTSEVVRASKNIEVALVLDTTGSMKGQNIIDLKAAAADLIDIVVKPPAQQTPFYSKVAIVPYSMGVNLGTYADTARPIRAPSITGISKANPAVITSTAHGLGNNEAIYISGVVGMKNGSTTLNNTEFRVSPTNNNTNNFKLQDRWGNNYSTSGWTNYTSGGTIDCFTYKCRSLRFNNVYGTAQERTISTCVSERIGTEAYTDAPPSTAPMGPNYDASGNPCLPNTIFPLSSSITDLKAQISSLTATGSTAGQVGVAWGWYTLAPNFNYLWPSNGASAYGRADTIKAVVIMTDGEYNSAYCNGVISSDSTSGSGSASDHINCNATNGSSYYQAGELCKAMKASGKGIIVYIVGFQLVNTTAATTLVDTCKTDDAHVYKANTSADLKVVFRQIGQDLSNLRIAR